MARDDNYKEFCWLLEYTVNSGSTEGNGSFAIDFSGIWPEF